MEALLVLRFRLSGVVRRMFRRRRRRHRRFHRLLLIGLDLRHRVICLFRLPPCLHRRVFAVRLPLRLHHRVLGLSLGFFGWTEDQQDKRPAGTQKERQKAEQLDCADNKLTNRAANRLSAEPLSLP